MDNEKTGPELTRKDLGRFAFSCPSRVTWIGFGFALMAGAAAGGSIRPAFFDPAAIVLDYRVLSPVVYSNENLHFLIDRGEILPPNCPGNITREYMRPLSVGGEVVPDLWRAAQAGAAIVRAGARKYGVHVPLADKMPFGHWEFTAATVFYCPFWRGGTQTYEVRGLKFEYRDRPASTSIERSPQ